MAILGYHVATVAQKVEQLLTGPVPVPSPLGSGGEACRILL